MHQTFTHFRVRRTRTRRVPRTRIRRITSKAGAVHQTSAECKQREHKTANRGEWDCIVVLTGCQARMHMLVVFLIEMEI